MSNLYAWLVNFSGSGRYAFGLIEALVEIIDRRKVISSRWRCTSACSSAIALLICSIAENRREGGCKQLKRGRVRVCVYEPSKLKW